MFLLLRFLAFLIPSPSTFNYLPPRNRLVPGSFITVWRQQDPDGIDHLVSTFNTPCLSSTGALAFHPFALVEGL